MLPDDPRHGSPRGWHAHRLHGEKACDPCREAINRYERRRRKVKELYDVEWLVDATGTRRRIQALHWMGWRGSDIGSRVGIGQARITAIATGERVRVHRHTATRIATVYDELSMTRGPSNITAKRARARGWLSPLAWDDVDNDEVPNDSHDIATTKDIDHAAVWRVLQGDVLPTNVAERREIMRRWVASGRSEKSLCERMGWKEGRYTLGPVGTPGNDMRDEREAS